MLNILVPETDKYVFHRTHICNSALLGWFCINALNNVIIHPFGGPLFALLLLRYNFLYETLSQKYNLYHMGLASLGFGTPGSCYSARFETPPEFTTKTIYNIIFIRSRIKLPTINKCLPINPSTST